MSLAQTAVAAAGSVMFVLWIGIVAMIYRQQRRRVD